MMIPKRRFLRRATVLATSALIFFFAGSLKHLLFGGYQPSRSPNRYKSKPITVTSTRTIFAQATRTIVVEVTPVAPPISEAVQIPAAARLQDDSPDNGRKRAAGDVQSPLNQQDAMEDYGTFSPHLYRPDGLLEVNVDGPHPIFELIKESKVTWENKLKKASTTLDEAVAEYVRRYKRQPPLGFDDWWYYVEDNSVQLPDEYDQIYNDLEPFWGMDPVDLIKIEEEWESHQDTYTIGKSIEDTKISLLNYSFQNDKVSVELALGAYEIIDLLDDVDKFIPPFRAIFSPHDNPNLHTDFELRQMALEAAAEGRYIDINNPPDVKLHGWISACDPLSPAWQDQIDYDNPPPPQTKKTFIYDHLQSMDPCLHPALLLQHGQFVSHYTGPVPHRKMIPQFSYCRSTLHHDITTAMPLNWINDIEPRSDDPEWDDKDDDRMLWRGSNTGIFHDTNTKWRRAQRARLIEWANALHGNISVLPSRELASQRVGKPREIRKSRFNPAMFDIQFSGEPISCAEETCRILKEEFEYRKRQNIKTAGQYKYVLDVDGNGWSSRFKRLITTNSLIFKSTIYPEWFGDRIQPWVHYIPVQVDLSDLSDSFVFFRGDANGDGAHEDLAREIATNGRIWSKTFWRKEDLTAYFFRLFLEYARVMSPDREAMSYKDLVS